MGYRRQKPLAISLFVKFLQPKGPMYPHVIIKMNVKIMEWYGSMMTCFVSYLIEIHGPDIFFFFQLCVYPCTINHYIYISFFDTPQIFLEQKLIQQRYF